MVAEAVPVVLGMGYHLLTLALSVYVPVEPPSGFVHVPGEFAAPVTPSIRALMASLPPAAQFGSLLAVFCPPVPEMVVPRGHSTLLSPL